jgi:L-amino acid N-acyltransferase YncA
MRLPRIFRTTTFRMTLLFLAVFAMSAAAFLFYAWFATAGEVTRRADAEITREMNSLEAVYRRGGAVALNQALIERAEAAGARQMLAVIGDSANTASIGLHAACGFRFAGLLHASGWKFGRWVDTVLMQRALGDGALTEPPPGC